MKPSKLTPLMHAALDGEATDSEIRELEQGLVNDPAARAEFDDLKRVFRALESIPKEHAPEGLVAAVTAALPVPPARNVRQLFPHARVLGTATTHTRGASPDKVATEQPTRNAGTSTGSHYMSEQSKTVGNRKAWFGVGIAAAAVLVVAQYGFDFPLGKDVTGTIMPAQRYRAEPNGSEAVKLGAPAGTAATPSAVAPLAAQAEKQANAQAERIVGAQAEKQVNAQAERTVAAQAEKQANAQAERIVGAQAEKQANAQAERTRRGASREAGERPGRNEPSRRKLKSRRTLRRNARRRYGSRSR